MADHGAVVVEDPDVEVGHQDQYSLAFVARPTLTWWNQSGNACEHPVESMRSRRTLVWAKSGWPSSFDVGLVEGSPRLHRWTSACSVRSLSL